MHIPTEYHTLTCSTFQNSHPEQDNDYPCLRPANERVDIIIEVEDIRHDVKRNAIRATTVPAVNIGVSSSWQLYYGFAKASMSQMEI
jgi:hypothetical protein